MSGTSSSSRSSSRKSRSRSRKQQIKINTKNEANAILSILENRSRNMGAETNRMQKMEKTLARLNKKIQEDSEKLKERVRGAEEEMRGRLGLDPELRWSEVRRMKWGADLDDETSISRTKSSSNGSQSPHSTEASSIERSSPRSNTPVKGRNEKKKTVQASPKKPTHLVPRYEEAIKHLDAVTKELKSIAVSSIVEDDDLLKCRVAVASVAEKLMTSIDKLKE